MKNAFINISLSIVTVLFCFFIFELYFRFVYVESDGLGITLAHKKWGAKYWKPINSLSLRDREWKDADLAGKKVIAVIGDSFPAGHGIKNIADRFPDVLASKLGKEYAVINISLPGWGTETELLAFKYFVSGRHVMFNTVIWSYFPNDILDLTQHLGKKPPDEIAIPKGITGKIISNSYFLNFVYWDVFKITKLKNDYFEWLKEQYNDPQTWNLHKKELEQICKDVKNSKAKLIVVTFPFLINEVKSDVILEKVKDLFNQSNVPVLDVSDIISGLKESEIVISKNDAHPSIKLHRLVANNLYRIISGDGKK